MQLEQSRIPKILHYVWFGKSAKPDYLVKNIESWKKYCPDWEIKEWNEYNFDIDSNQFAKEAYESEKWAFVSDYVRLKVVEEYGGVYLDTDVELFRPIDDFLVHDFFANFENDNMLCFTVFGARKGSPILKGFSRFYEGRSFFFDKNKKKPDLTPNVISGSVFFKNRGNVALNGKNQEVVVLGEKAFFYDKEYFFAQDYVTKKITRTEKCHGIHYYAASWLTKKEKRVDRVVEFIHFILPERFFRFCMRKFLGLRVNKYDKKFSKTRPDVFLKEKE